MTNSIDVRGGNKPLSAAEVSKIRGYQKAGLSQEALRERHELSKVTSSERRALQRRGDEPRNDSFKSLTHKLEGEGKSARYAKAIAGKVAKEKGDIGKKDAQSDDDRAAARNAASMHRDAAKFLRGSYRSTPKRNSDLKLEYKKLANRHEGAAKDIEGMELDAQEKGDPWSDQNTRRDATLAQADDLDPDRIKHDLDNDRHKDADRAVEKSIERHARKRSNEDAPMADKSEMRKRLDEIMSQVKDLCDELGDDDDAHDDAESEAERSAAGKVARRHQLETERDDAMSHAEHVRIGKESHRDDEDEHDAGEELAEGHEDVEHGDKAEGEELEHEAGEAEAEDRDHGDDDDDGDGGDGDDGGDGGDDVREHRGDQAPEDVAESVTEADAQSSRRSVGVKRSFNNRHDSNEDSDMTQRSDEDIRRRIDVLDARLKRATRSASYKERDELSRIRARCDSVAQALGVRPEAPLPGEFPDEYRRRCAALLQPFSQSTKGVSIGRLDDAAFKVVEDRIYADAQSAAREPIKSLAGRLVPVESHDAAGRTITKYYGDPKAWMRPYMAPGVHIRFADSATRRNTGAR